MLTRQHPDFPNRTWHQGLVAEELGISRKHLERLLNGRDQAQSLGITTAEKWADRFQLHPIDIWGDAYLVKIATMKVAA